MSADAFESAARSAKTAAKLRAFEHPVLVGQRASSRQRKWRVLLSIGLLLPALAAIIGIVAWTISIEVAQQGDRTAGNGRRTQHSQPTSRAAPPPQFLAFRRPSSAQADEKLASARTSAKERNRTSDNQEPEQAGVVGAPEGRIAVSARSRAEPSSTTSWPTPAGSEKSSESEPERDEESILAADEAPGNGKRETSSSDLPAQLKPAERARLEDDSERASQDASSSKPDKLVSLLLTNLEQVHAIEGAHRARSRSSQGKVKPDEHLAKSKKAHKQSRWLSDDKYELEPLAKSERVGETEAEAGKIPEIASAKAVKNDKQLTMKMLMIRSGRLNVEQPSSSTEGTPLPETGRYIGGERQPKVERASADLPSSEPASSDSAAADEEGNNDNRNQLRSAGEADPASELAFEAIASAISSSLTKNMEAPEGDTGSLSSLDEQPAPPMTTTTSHEARKSASPISANRQRTAGEHVAEVIDHIVERRRQANRAASVRGPQIVVVAPVGGSDESMKARSLTKTVELKADKERAVAKKEAQRKKPAAKRPIGARLLGVAGQTPAESKGEPARFSERVQVIEEDDSSGLLSPRADADEWEGSAHLASAPGLSKLRAPRHGPASEPDEGKQGARLYSTEQLIREHVLKSKQQPVRQHSYAPDTLQNVSSTSQREQANGAPDGPISSTTGAPTSTVGDDRRPQYYQSAGVQPVQVPLFIEQRMAPLLLRPNHQDRPHPEQRPYQHPHQHHQQQQHQQQPMQTDNLQPAGSNQLPYLADQEFSVPAHMAESVIQEIQRQPAATLSMLDGRPTLTRTTNEQMNGQVPPSFSHQQQYFHPNQPYAAPQQLSMASHNVQHQRQPHWDQMMMARLVAQQSARPPLGPEHRQVLANRDEGEGKSMVKPARSIATHPVAQMALRHLFSTIGRDQASAEAGRQQRSADAIHAAGSAPEPANAPPVAPGAIGEPRQAPAMGAGQDQEVQESYGQMPAYQMGGQPAYEHQQGGGYEQAGYGQSEHDKKSKGVTFHFGGGPIGGGTQLITSPMGIFKHLMIPLLPNPRVNLNGKVVFGVVLEKTTAFGEPKKKYKFWG